MTQCAAWSFLTPKATTPTTTEKNEPKKEDSLLLQNPSVRRQRLCDLSQAINSHWLKKYKSIAKRVGGADEASYPVLDRHNARSQRLATLKDNKNSGHVAIEALRLKVEGQKAQLYIYTRSQRRPFAPPSAPPCEEAVYRLSWCSVKMAGNALFGYLVYDPLKAHVYWPKEIPLPPCKPATKGPPCPVCGRYFFPYYVHWLEELISHPLEVTMRSLTEVELTPRVIERGWKYPLFSKIVHPIYSSYLAKNHCPIQPAPLDSTAFTSELTRCIAQLVQLCVNLPST
ncbi:protein ORF57 [Lake sturgeon herpesvirus]|nr:protein ORF57 [Lake sturgeon herpesvirus]